MLLCRDCTDARTKPKQIDPLLNNVLQVQAVTEVGAGNFSSPPVTVMLVDSSDNPGSTSAVSTAIVSVLGVIIGALSVIAIVLSIFIYR